MNLNEVLNNLINEEFHSDNVVDNATKDLIKLLKGNPLGQNRYQALIFALLNAFNHTQNDVDASWNALSRIAEIIKKGENHPWNSEVLDAILDKQQFKDEEHRNDKNEISYGPMSINFDSHTLTIHDHLGIEEYKKIPRQQFEILYLLMSKPNVYFTRDKILDKVWKDNQDVNDRLIDVKISQFKKYFLKKHNLENVIRNIKGRGYVFNPPK